MSVPQSAMDLRRPASLGVRLLVARLSRLRRGRLTVVPPSGPSIVISGTERGPEAEMRLHRPAAMAARVGCRGVLGLGESYLAGDWSSPDLAPLLTLLADNEVALTGGRPDPGGWLTRLRHRRRRNTRPGSRRNIRFHYDLGNDFYRLWLDETMTYSGAEYETPDQDLAAAQRHKYRRILDALEPAPGDRLLEIGCGWGSLALEAARRGARVTALTLSREQRAFALRQAAAAGLADRVDVHLQDYRDVRGEFDQVVSVEMLEAVGEDFWGTYFGTLARCVRPGGRVLLHGITIDEPWFESYRRSPDFIQRYVFPGGMLPTRARLVDGLRAAGLALRDELALGAHYARTLAAWRRRFLAQQEAITALGFGERFLRLWHYYLAYCEAGFVTGRVDLLRLTLQRPAAG